MNLFNLFHFHKWEYCETFEKVKVNNYIENLPVIMRTCKKCGYKQIKTNFNSPKFLINDSWRDITNEYRTL
jgi:hypothetical protein